MNVGPCLSPISLALQQFHKPKKPQAEKHFSDSSLVNPMVSRKIVYSPPLSRRLKRKRSAFEEEDEEEECIMSDISLSDSEVVRIGLDIPGRKKQKTVASRATLSVGQMVHARFESNRIVRACVVIIESFGVLLSINEEQPDLDVRMFSKHWSRWRGEVSEDDVPVVDVVHQAD